MRQTTGSRTASRADVSFREARVPQPDGVLQGQGDGRDGGRGRGARGKGAGRGLVGQRRGVGLGLRGPGRHKSPHLRPAGAPRAKLRQISAYGAEVHAVDGDRQATSEAAVGFYREHGLVYASHKLSPFFLEGTKTFAYEVALQLGVEGPTHVVFPWETEACAWVRGRASASSVKPDAWTRCRGCTVSSPGRSCRWWPPTKGSRGAPTPRRHDSGRDRHSVATEAGADGRGSPDTGGVAVAVDDADILRWRKTLATEEGAAAFAGLDGAGEARRGQPRRNRRRTHHGVRSQGRHRGLAVGEGGWRKRVDCVPRLAIECGHHSMRRVDHAEESGKGIRRQRPRNPEYSRAGGSRNCRRGRPEDRRLPSPWTIADCTDRRPFQALAWVLSTALLVLAEGP